MDFGRLFIIVGIVLVIVGVAYSFLGASGVPKLPGDILIRRGNFTFYFPVVTSIIVSIVLTIILHFFLRK